MPRLYDVFSVPADTKEPQKGGRKLNATPMTLQEVKVFVSKFTEHKERIIVWRRWVPAKPGSWIIVRKDTGEAVMETFEEDTAKAINTKNYKALPALEYLQAFNAKIKEGNHA